MPSLHHIVITCIITGMEELSPLEPKTFPMAADRESFSPSDTHLAVFTVAA
jgi:hypothetical protein